MRLKRYREIEKICNENCGSKDCEDCDKCIYRDLLSEYETGYPFVLRVKDKISFEFSNRLEIVKNIYASHHKQVYRCCICGVIEAPCFRKDKNMRVSLRDGYGWGIVRTGSFRPKYICHHCLWHFNDTTPDCYNELKRESNKRVISDIKETDLDYYLKHKKELDDILEN